MGCPSRGTRGTVGRARAALSPALTDAGAGAATSRPRDDLPCHAAKSVASALMAGTAGLWLKAGRRQ